MTFTSEQHEAVARLDDNLCVVAGAGTGKTRVLVERFLHLMEVGGCEPSQLAAITFTEKAAAEMLSRLRDSCAERMARADDDARRQIWKRRLEDLGDAAVTTIHGFCRRLLAQNPVEAGLDPRFTILSDARSSQLMGDSVHRTLRERFEASDPDVLAATQAYSLSTLQQMLRDALLHRDAVRIAATRSERPLQEQLADLEQVVISAMTAACDGLLADAGLTPLRHMVTSVAGPQGDGRELSREVAAEALLRKAGQVLDQVHAAPLTAESAARASIAVAEAKVLTTEISLLASEKLFELAGSRATLAEFNLDRHWRNARVHTLHDPVRWKYHAVGAYRLNGTLPARHSWI